jgi:transcriptional regulator with XRE-family HTH domain
MPIDLQEDSFDTSWTEDDAKKLYAKRCREGMTLNDVARIIGVDRSTVLKWEKRQVTRCSAVHLYAIRQFMKESYNFVLRNQMSLPQPMHVPPLIAAILQELEKIRIRLSILPREYPGDHTLLEKLKHIHNWIAEKRRNGSDID